MTNQEKPLGVNAENLYVDHALRFVERYGCVLNMIPGMERSIQR